MRIEESEPESTSPLNLVTGSIIAGLAILLLAFFVITSQPRGLAVGATLSFLVIAASALFLVGRDKIVAEPYTTPAPERAARSEVVQAKLPSKLAPACSRCNEEISPSNKFCPNCGRKLTAADFAPPSP